MFIFENPENTSELSVPTSSLEGTRSYSKEGFVLEIPNIVPALLR